MKLNLRALLLRMRLTCVSEISIAASVNRKIEMNSRWRINFLKNEGFVRCQSATVA